MRGALGKEARAGAENIIKVGSFERSRDRVLTQDRPVFRIQMPDAAGSVRRERLASRQPFQLGKYRPFQEMLDLQTRFRLPDFDPRLARGQQLRSVWAEQHAIAVL